MTADLIGSPRWEGNEVVWDGDQFVALGFREHWTSVDGREWTYVEGTPLVAATQWRCPDGFECEVSGGGTEIGGDAGEVERYGESIAPEPVPLHYSRAFGSPVAAGSDRVLFSRQFQYSPFQDWLPEERLEGDQPVHPDLLTLAAEREPCFARLLEQQTTGSDRGAALESWGITGRSDGWRVTLRCRFEGGDGDGDGGDNSAGAGAGAGDSAGESDSDSDVVVFTEQLAPYLDEADQARLDQLPQELWIEYADGTVEQIDDPPTTEFWADGQANGRLIETVSKVASSGQRLWSTDRGRLVVSEDGATWGEVPLDGASVPVDGQAMEAYATFGGHVAVVVVDDARLPRQGDARWIVTNDDGGSWSRIDGPGFSWLPRLAVGPLGLLWSDGEVGYRFATVDGETIDIEVDQPTGQPAVGADRVVVHEYEVVDGDGELRSYVLDQLGNRLFEIDR